MTDYTELKRLAEAHVQKDIVDPIESTRVMLVEPKTVLALIAENERLAASVKLNLCDYPAIHRGDVDLLISFVSGTSQIELAELHQCTPPNISRKIRRVKERLGWKAAMGPLEICARADQLRALASQGAVVTADLMAERDQLKAENEALRKDSDRYQWLRDKSEAVHQFYLSVPLWFTGVRFRAQDVDNAIDAMSKGEQS